MLTKTTNPELSHIGWYSEKHHGMSWCLSLLRLKSLGFKVTLYTDKQGFNWLIKYLKLPYDDVKVELDSLNYLPTTLWAYPKLWVYAQQREAFYHIDGDVFIWDINLLKVPKSNEIICQHLEVDYSCYKDMLTNIFKKNYILPSNYFTNNDLKHTIALNCGVIGGSNPIFFKLLWDTAIKIYNENIENIKNEHNFINIIFEQLLGYKISREMGLKITPLFKNSKNNCKIEQKLLQFELAPFREKYIHLFGTSKKDPTAMRELENRLFFEFNEYWKIITYKYKNNEDNLYIDYDSLNNYNYDHMFVKTKFKKDICTILGISNNCDLDNYEYLNKVYKLIYNTNPRELLNYKYKLKPNFTVVETNYVYRNICLMRYINNKNKPITNTSNDKIEHYIAKWNNDIYLTPITGWNMLLRLFIDKELTGWELVSIIREYGLIKKEDNKVLEELVEGFLASKLLFFNEIQISEN